ncbi:MAG: hypothetical protein ACUVV0_06585 [Anaerolineae bacterium]
MAERKITLTLPEDLCQEAEKAGLLSSEFFEAALRNALNFLSWEKRIAEIQMQIQKAGGTKKTKQEVIDELRATRRRIWEENYRERYIGSRQQ